MIGPSGGAVVFGVLFVLTGLFLAASFLVAIVLTLLGRSRLRRVGLIWLGLCIPPGAVWSYLFLRIQERDRYMTLTNSEVVYGIPLPAGTQVNYRKWSRRVQWVVLGSPQVIDGVEYTGQVTFRGRRVLSGTLARDQQIQGVPCRARSHARFAEEDGRLLGCSLENDSR